MNPRIGIGRIMVAALWVVVTLPSLAFGETGTTFTTSSSSQTGTINAHYIFTTNALGPTSINIGALTGCTLVGSPPFPGCILDSGTGTSGDPFIFTCSSPLTLTGCSGGTPFAVVSGTQNFDSHTQTVVAVATASTQPVPLGPWVPLVSAGGVLLTALLLRRRKSVRA